MASSIINDINPSDQIFTEADPPDLAENAPVFSLTNTPLTITEISNACDQLQSKNSLDFNNLSMNFLKKVISNIFVPLAHVFSLSLSSGVVPQQLKIAKVVPVYKSGCKDSMDNYRPISLLGCFSKVLEKIVCARLSDFLEVNNLLSGQ